MGGFWTGDYFNISASGGVNTETHYLAGVYGSDCHCKDTCRPVQRRLDSVLGAGGHLRVANGIRHNYLKGAVVTKVANASYGSTCFPGDATVNVYGQGTTDVASLSVGDRVLVGSDFEPVLGFLHKVPAALGSPHEALTVVHAQGTFQASENHLVFVASEAGVREDKPVSALRPGDQLLVESGLSPILAIRQEVTTAGMYAPFTSSGAIVVDGVVASNYGTPASGLSLPHAAAHAAFFGLRAYHYLGFGKLLGSPRGRSGATEIRLKMLTGA